MAFKTRRGGGYASRPTRGWPSYKFQKRVEPTVDLDKHPLGQLLTTIRSRDLVSTADGSTVSGSTSESLIKDCAYIASYNWLNKDSPAILVPGNPPKWTPSSTPQTLQEDEGTYFRDPNAAHYPPFPTLPGVLAILSSNPTFPTTEVDLVACGNTLGNLLRFARSVSKPFRFTVHAIGSTVFLVRKENHPREVIKGVHGFGHTFPEAYTTWERSVKGSDSHQRLIQYDFAGLNCVVRFECDGYIPSSSTNTTSTKAPAPTSTPDIDTLINDFAATTTTTTNTSTTSSPLDPATPLTVNHTTNPIAPQSTIFDLKTRSGKWGKVIDMQDQYPILWLKQIPNFIVAYHDGHGGFDPTKIHVDDVRGAVRDWEVQNAKGIRRFADLLRRIVGEARRMEGTVLEVYCPDVERLEIRRVAGEEWGDVLPRDVRERWERGCAAEEDGGIVVESEEESRSIREESDDDEDFTGCSAEGCGYCGKCSY